MKRLQVYLWLLAAALVVGIWFSPSGDEDEAPPVPIGTKPDELRSAVPGPFPPPRDLRDRRKREDDFNARASAPSPEELLTLLAASELKRKDLVLSFTDSAKAADFAAEAPARGIEIVAESGPLVTLRVRLRDPIKAGKFLEERKDDLKMEWNRPVWAPAHPRAEYLDGEKGFADQAADWLDVPPERSEWGRGVTVAVLDTGVNVDHPALKGAEVISIDLVGGPHGPDGAYLGHGTAVASLIAGSGEGVEGLAPAARILSVRVLDGQGGGDSFTVARGIVEAVDKGARVLNLSLGSASDSHVLQQAVDYARSKGAVVVAAVGNKGVRGVTYPAGFEGVVGVTSVDAKGRQSAFANYGEGVDIAAPGVDVHAAWAGAERVSFSGTSSSTAFVSAALAAELSRNPELPGEQVVDLLYKYANEAEKPGLDPLTGNGVLNVGRIENRQIPGIRDAAVVGYYFDPAELKGGTTPFLVNVQNQGTEHLAGLTLEVEYGGLNRNFLIGSLSPGEVRSEKLYVDAATAADPEGVRIRSAIKTPQGQDAKPDNDVRVSRITLPSSR